MTCDHVASSYTISGCNCNCNEEDEGENLGMAGCVMVSDSSNICYEAVSKTTIEENFAFDYVIIFR